MLTVQKATSQARRLANGAMAGAGATVESRLAHDLATDTPLVVTVITYPAGHAGETLLGVSLMRLPGVIKLDGDPSRLVITRSRSEA